MEGRTTGGFVRAVAPIVRSASFRLTSDPNQLNRGRQLWEPVLVKRDKDGEAEAENEDGDEEVAVCEDSFGSLGFVHLLLLGFGTDDR